MDRGQEIVLYHFWRAFIEDTRKMVQLYKSLGLMRGDEQDGLQEGEERERQRNKEG
jgi:hypothetical protein